LPSGHRRNAQVTKGGTDMTREVRMTPAQRKEVARMTSTMWSVLYVARRPPKEERWIGGPTVRSANILAERGFITMQRKPGGLYSVRLTDAGTQALNQHENRG
jgi:hypothetical protein